MSVALIMLLAGLTASPSMHGMRGSSVTAFDESISTVSCIDSTPKSAWNLGQTACAVATGALADRRIAWVAPDGAIAQESNFFSGTLSDQYAIPTGSDRFAQVGTWAVEIIDPSGVASVAAEFVVRDADNANADLAIGKYGPSQIAADANINYRVEIINHGPDDAQGVTLTDSIPANTSFVSATQTSGPTFTEPTPAGNGTITCTITTLPANAIAIFSFTFHVNAGTANGTVITNVANISSNTNDARAADNTAENSASVAGASAVCTLTCPGDMTVTANPNQCSAVVNYSTPTASGNCGSDPAVCNPPSGSTFPIGTTAVNCSNGSGGECSFNVTVTGNDTAPPSMTCPSNITTPEDSPGSGSANVSYSTPPATDNCTQGVQVFCSPPSGSSFPTGPATTVTCTATDASNNTTSCTFTVTVSTAECTLTCPQNITEPASSGCSKVVSYAVPGQSGSCGTVSCDPASGSVFPVGTTTVTCTATDSSGNTITTCSFTVTITGGTLTCPSNIVTNEDPPGGSATVFYQEPASCSGAAVTCNPPSGSSFPVGTTTVTCTSADTGSCSFTVTVQTGSPCTITCPNITKGNDPGQCGAVAIFPTKSGNCGSEPISCNPPSGSFFPIGTTSVTCDFDGTSCTFTVTVNDTQPPTINCPANVSVTAAVGQTSTVVSFSATATDNCPTPTIACVPPSGSAFGLGVTTVSCTATDGSGNQAGCSFNVAVSGTLLATADSFLRDGADNTNEGGNELLRIQNSGNNRVLVRFDTTGIPIAGLQSATLKLSIGENSDNWGPTGRLVDAHRLLADWTEGDGHTVGSQPNFRGTGEGVTWKCAKDSNIANQNDDCTTPWNGGTYAGATAASVLHTNNQTGNVSWNVIADVQAGAGNGWLISKQAENQNGQVRYISKEGSASAGPRLVLVYQP